MNPSQGQVVLDVATGTADVAIALAAHYPCVKQVIGIDLAEGMLTLGRRKVRRLGLDGVVSLQQADALMLPFKDASFSAVTVAFGLRNMSDLMKALIEAYRILVPGGRLIILEFSRPRNPIVGMFHSFYLQVVVPVIGGLLSGHRGAYKYLSRTISSFPYGDRFQRIVLQVGFARVNRYELALGAASVYVAEKPCTGSGGGPG